MFMSRELYVVGGRRAPPTTFSKQRYFGGIVAGFKRELNQLKPT
jgi:hypothetical protein